MEKVLYLRAKIREFKEWLFGKKPKPEMKDTGGGGPLPLQEIAYVLLAVSLLVGAWALFQRLTTKAGANDQCTDLACPS